MILGVMALALLGAAAEASVTAGEIMARVAENQDRAQSLRQAYVYHQTVTHQVRKPNGTLLGDRVNEYDVIPAAKGFEKKPVSSSSSGERIGSIQWQFNDSGRADISNDTLMDDDSRDGIGPRLFPLTADEQRHYTFALAGREKFEGTEVFRLHFEPKRMDDPAEIRVWAGDVLVDAAEFQPALIRTRLSRRVPVAVQILLGTNIKNLDFRLAYRKFEDGVWFPVDYRTDFNLRVLFLYNRHISFFMKNEAFRKTDVQSSVEFEK
ncbi:MAG: hypothetical protein M3Z36_02945 [Acidobacteriota bacterium]|nr:hypothetical protein [Acidobacteriota bacterium]